MNKPALSIVIISFNEEKHLPVLLESLRKQTFQDFEIILSDNHSKDKTRQIAKSYECIITDGGNWTIGRNNGAKLAKADYILFLDSDSYLPPKFLETNFPLFKKSKKGSATIHLKPLSKKPFDFLFFKLYDIWSTIMSKVSPHCAGCGFFVRTRIFRKLGGLNERLIFAEHHDFTRRAKKYGFIILPHPMYTSVRRLDKDGRLNFIGKYIYAGLYRLFYKEIDSSIFKYEPFD